MLYATAQSLRSNTPQLRYHNYIVHSSHFERYKSHHIYRVLLAEAGVDWYCARTRKQDHRIQVETPGIKLLLKFDNELDSHAWYQVRYREYIA